MVHAQVIRMEAHRGLKVVKGDQLQVPLPYLPPAQIFYLPEYIYKSLIFSAKLIICKTRDIKPNQNKSTCFSYL